jgi:hypothetical protein
MKVLITGADGFIGKNLRLHLAERKADQVVCFTAPTPWPSCQRMLAGVDFVFHLAGHQPPARPAEFTTGNADLTGGWCRRWPSGAAPRASKVRHVCTSSTQAARDNPYGQSKRAAEDALFALQRKHRRAGARVSPAQCVWQVVQAQLQLGGGHLLPQHRRAGCPLDQRPGSAGDAGVCGRRGASALLQLLDGADARAQCPGFCHRGAAIHHHGGRAGQAIKPLRPAAKR